MKNRVLFTVLVVTMLMSTTISAHSWWFSKYRVSFDNDLGIVRDVTLGFHQMAI